MYPRARLDALSDAVFGVAMTLLVLDVRLPEEFHPHDASELLQALVGLLPKFLPYVLSFVVLGLRWLSNIQVRSHVENFSRAYVNWWLLYLLLITCVPFTTMVVGRFANLAPATGSMPATRFSFPRWPSACWLSRRTSSGTTICAIARHRSYC